VIVESRQLRAVTIWAVVALCLAVGIALVGSAGAGDGPPPTVDASLPDGDGRFPDALDARSSTAVSLAEALGRIPRHLPLHDVAVTGDAVRAEVDDWDGKAPAEYGLLVLYASGVKLMVQPGEMDLDEKVKAGGEAVFTDGATTHYLVDTIAGRRALVVTGGTQVLTVGEYAVPNMVVWNDAGFTYKLQADTGTVPLDTLVSIARSVH
jgi:hypothetical protein